jgi:2,3-bisphosphoglycerate-dependent phosphoglycerate mutase
MRNASRLLGLLAAALCLALLGLWWRLRCDGPDTTLLLVRHAERDGKRDTLTAAGLERAAELVHVAQRAEVSAVYHSDTIRTRDTAQPLARALGLVAIERPASAIAALVDEILAQHPGRTVLIVGHSNTVPQIISEAGGPELGNIAEDEFDNLFVLTTCGCRQRPPKLVRLQYGAASP